MDVTSSTFRCSQCGREASAIFRCPERRHAECPFVTQWTWRSWIYLAGAGILGSVLAIEFQSVWLLIAGLVLGILLWSFIVEELAYDARSGIALQRTTVLGVEVKLTARVRGEDVAPSPAPIRPVRYALSVLMLASQPQSHPNEDALAASILRAALIDLHMRQLIDLHVLYRRALRNIYGSGTIKDYYVTKSNRSTKDDMDLGNIEQQLLQAIRIWDCRDQEQFDWPEGLAIYDLIRAFYGHDRTNPARDVLKAAESEAMQHELCKITPRGSWLKRTETTWNGEHAAESESDRRAAEEYLDRWSRAQPDAWTMMHAEAVRAIKSRIDSGD